MSSITAMADQIIEEVAGMFSAEHSLRRIPNGLEWGRPGARQRLWWENPVAGSDGGPDLVRTRILTEVAGLPPDPADWPEQLAK